MEGYYCFIKTTSINQSTDYQLFNINLFLWHSLGNAACKIIDQHGHYTHNRLRRHFHCLLLAVF